MARFLGKMPVTRNSLLEGIKDPENYKRWAEFEKAYASPLRNGLRMSGLRDDEIEDVVQNVLIEVSRTIGKFAYDRSKGKFGTWLKKVTTFRAIDQMRKRRTTEEKKVHCAPEDTRGTDTIGRIADLDEGQLEKQIHEEWARAVIDRTLASVRERVAPEQFQLYDAYVIQGWPVEKVIKTFGKTANQVYIAKTRVGEIVKEEGFRVAAEMDAPEMPPEHPSVSKV